MQTIENRFQILELFLLGIHDTPAVMTLFGTGHFLLPAVQQVVVVINREFGHKLVLDHGQMIGFFAKITYKRFCFISR